MVYAGGLLRSAWQGPLWGRYFGIPHAPLVPVLQADSEHQWQQGPPDGEPPVAPPKGTICLMVSLVMGVRARVMEEKGLVEPKLAGVLQLRREGMWFTRFAPPLPGSGTFSLGEWLGSCLPFPRTDDPALSLSIQQHAVRASWTYFCQVSLPHGALASPLRDTRASGADASVCCFVPGMKGGEQTSLSPRYCPCPPSAPGRCCFSASHWQRLVLELSTTLIGPS